MNQANVFQSVMVQTPDSNRFDLSHDNKLSLDSGNIYPVLVMETIPGDKFTIQSEALLRMAPMLYPLMHQVNVFIHFFYVPNRIIWNGWEKFLGGENIVLPFIQGVNSPSPGTTLPVEVGSFLDYMGLPITTDMKEPITCLAITAYYSIINQYYQDQNNDSFYPTLTNILEALKAKNGYLKPTDFFSGSDLTYEFGFGKRAWEHDYFTSCLPFAQKGPAVKIPITLNDLPVEVYEVLKIGGGTPTVNGTLKNVAGVAYTDDGVNPAEGIKFAGLTDSSGASLEGTINQLRVSYALQRYYELNARAGTRYNEIMKGRWGINIGDDRISRPEYIGGVKNNIVISEVLQTSATTPSDNALGEYAGHGTGVLSGNPLSYTCLEHGYVIGLMSVIPRSAYFQGIPKHYSRRLLEDYFQPEFAHIGEQEVKNKELYYDNSLTDNNDAFGYLPIGSELKYIPSGVHGQFQTTFLPFHLARKFDNRPNLNEEFIYVNDEKRIYAVTDPDVNSLYAHVFFNIRANRKIPFYSTPI